VFGRDTWEKILSRRLLVSVLVYWMPFDVQSRSYMVTV
jgi:hypothetical protein